MATYNYGSTITGTLTGTTANVKIPFNVTVASIVLNSSDGTRTIQVSFDGGTIFYPAVTPTLTDTNQIVYTLPYPVSNILFTGAIADTYIILP
jgi:hypothetical protein